MIRCFGLYGFEKKADVCNGKSLEKVDLDPDIIPEAVIEQMRLDVKIEPRGGDRRGDRATVAFTISYRGPDRQIVADVANALASSYILENQKMRGDQAQGTANFLRNAAR